MTDNPQKSSKKREIKLQFPPNLSAVYSNMAVLSSTKNEFIMDFAQMLPPQQQAKVQTRVVTTPQHAKLLMTLLQRNIERYEAQHGPIEVTLPQSLADQLFSSIAPDGDDDDSE